MDRSLSALIAVCNVQSTLRAAALEMLDVMSELTNRFELVIIDDCSTDATIEVADELTAVYPQLLVIRQPIPGGYAAAIRTGIDRSLGEVVFFADEGCRLPLNQVRRLWAALGEYELVFARPGGPDELPDAAYGPAWSGGGYQMGHRRVLWAVADALGERPALVARLQQCGISWREIPIGGAVPRLGRRVSPPGRPFCAGTVSSPTDRSMRADPPEMTLGKLKQPNFESLDAKNPDSAAATCIRPKSW